jgi:glycerol-3-phosphate dehydrogenase
LTTTGSNRRATAIEAIGSGTFDVLVIGGGINGAGVARDIALRAKTSGRQIRTALVDKHHFGSGTSGRNSHLIHGGLRYLKYFDFGLVREALHERATLLEIAPHLVEPLAFVMPFESRFRALFYRSGLFLYDLLAGRATIERHRALSKRELQLFDASLRTEQFQSGAIFYDARVASARLVLENVIEAVANGVHAANYVEVVERRRESESWVVRLRDTIAAVEFTSRARTIIDATGAWADTGDVRLVRGSHIIVPHRGSRDHAIAYFEDSGRIVFFVPWGEARDLLLIGTTDVDHGSGPEDVRISNGEVDYLREVTRKVLRDRAVDEPIAAFSSLRPLVRETGRSATSTSREHRIWCDADGVVRITGGKYTTYRSMSAEAVDLALPELRGYCSTASTPLNGNSRQAIDALLAQSRIIAARSGVTERDVQRLIRTYGVRLPDFLADWTAEAEAAPIAFAAKHEMAERLTDVLLVSTTWGYEGRWTFEQLLPYASVLARHHAWDEERTRAEAQRALESIGQPPV